MSAGRDFFTPHHVQSLFSIQTIHRPSRSLRDEGRHGRLPARSVGRRVRCASHSRCRYGQRPCGPDARPTQHGRSHRCARHRSRRQPASRGECLCITLCGTHSRPPHRLPHVRRYGSPGLRSDRLQSALFRRIAEVPRRWATHGASQRHVADGRAAQRGCGAACGRRSGGACVALCAA